MKTVMTISPAPGVNLISTDPDFKVKLEKFRDQWKTLQRKSIAIEIPYNKHLDAKPFVVKRSIP